MQALSFLKWVAGALAGLCLAMEKRSIFTESAGWVQGAAFV